MPDTPESSNSSTTKTDDSASSSIFDGEIGDDWGEAFEADDFTLSAEDDISNEFIFEDETEGPEVTEGVADEQDEPSADVEKTGTTFPSFLASLLAQITSILQKCKASFLSLPILYRIPLLIAFCLVVLVLPYFFSKTSSPPVQPVQTIVTEQTTENITPLPEEIVTQNVAPPIEAEAPEEKTRKKWRFPSFLISTSDEMKGDNIFFIEVDITFILLLSEGESIPAEKEVFLRDIIYQFFNNRPLYELRRYSLARGEMNRKLRSWVEKQWPEGDIASIVFNRYQVL